MEIELKKDTPKEIEIGDLIITSSGKARLVCIGLFPNDEGRAVTKYFTLDVRTGDVAVVRNSFEDLKVIYNIDDAKIIKSDKLKLIEME